jgi:c-di-GMP-binding flagellar brake protein YcgR
MRTELAESGGPPGSRRREARISAWLDVELTIGDDFRGPFLTNSVNLSLGGMCVRSERSVAVGQPLGLRLLASTGALEVQGVVAWVQPRTSMIGLRFVDVSEDVAVQLESLVLLAASSS